MTAIFQTAFSSAFSWRKMFKFRSWFHWSLFPSVQWWLIYWRIYTSLGLNELIPILPQLIWKDNIWFAFYVTVSHRSIPQRNRLIISVVLYFPFFRMPGFVLTVTTSIAFLMSPSKCWNSQHGWAPFRYGQLQIQLYFHTLNFAAVGHDWSAQMGNRCLCCAYVRLVPRGFLSSRSGASANIIFFTEDQDIIWGHK